LISLLRREGLTYHQIANWRKAHANGNLTDKARGPQANPNRAEVRQLEMENALLKRKLEQAEAIIDAQTKLAQLLDKHEGAETILKALAEKIGLRRACDVLKVPRSRVYRALQPKSEARPQPSPRHTLFQEVRAEIREILNSEA